MKKILKKKTSGRPSKSRQNMYRVVVVVLVAGVGIYFLSLSHAATNTASIEAESGTLSGATAQTDSSASGGQYVQFGSSSSASLNCTNPVYQATWPQTAYPGWADPNNSNDSVNGDIQTGSNGTDSQQLNVCSTSNWNVVANFTDQGGSINTYPDTEFDLTGDKTVSQYNSLETCFGEKEPTPSGPEWPTAGGSEWDYAYDVWLNDHTGEDVWANDIEIMVWNDWTDTSLYPPAVGNVADGGSRAVTIDGVGYHMFQGGGANEWIYDRDTMTTSGCFDMLDIMKDLIANESAASGITTGAVPEHVEYGVEISGTHGTQTFQITNATLTTE